MEGLKNIKKDYGGQRIDEQKISLIKNYLKFCEKNNQ